MKIDILVSTNGSSEERKFLNIPQDAINEFLNLGFVDGIYDGTFSYKCLPRAFNPETMEIIINLKEVGEAIIAWGTIIGVLLNLIKKSTGYKPFMQIYYEKGNEKKHCSIPIKETDNVENILKEINKVLK